jgi:hypothetical protein
LPTYQFKNKETNEIEEYAFSYTKLEEFKQQNPHLEMHFSIENFPVYSDGVRLSVPGTTKCDPTFEKYVIDRMKKSIPGNRLEVSHKTNKPREW